MKTLTLQILKDYPVPRGALALWWLGQAGFILKSPAGKLIAIDPYLSNSLEAEAKRIGLDLRRKIPVPMVPEELVGIDLYVMTHSHMDHMDPETLKPYRAAGGNGPYLAPPETWQRLQEQLGVPPDQIIMTWPNKTHVVGDLTLRTTFAIGYGGDDLTHVGYLVSVSDGPTFYFTGDTAYEDLLWLSVREHHPDVMIAVINGAFRNMGPAEAAKLALQVDPEIVIPCHHDMFPSNSIPAQMLQTNLIGLGIGQKYHTIGHAEPYCYSSAKTGSNS